MQKQNFSVTSLSLFFEARYPLASALTYVQDRNLISLTASGDDATSKSLIVITLCIMNRGCAPSSYHWLLLLYPIHHDVIPFQVFLNGRQSSCRFQPIHPELKLIFSLL